MSRLSTYAEKLSSDQAKRRYEDKIKLIGTVDPFLLSAECHDVGCKLASH